MFCNNRFSLVCSHIPRPPPFLFFILYYMETDIIVNVNQRIKIIVKYVRSYITCTVVHTLMQRSVAGIEWIAVHRKNQYRVGHRGKVHMMQFPHQIVLMVIILHIINYQFLL